MSIGKVILVVLATLVIFSTGLVTGLMVMKQMPKPAFVLAGAPAPQPGFGMQQFLRRMQGELELTPEQHQRVGAILRETQERTRGLARAEFGKVQDQIRAELKPGQREKFERLLKERQRRALEVNGNRPFMRPMPEDDSAPPESPRRPPLNGRPPPSDQPPK